MCSAPWGRDGGQSSRPEWFFGEGTPTFRSTNLARRKRAGKPNHPMNQQGQRLPTSLGGDTASDALLQQPLVLVSAALLGV